MSKKEKADQYAGLHESHQTFPNIGLMEAVNGMVLLRGRHGQRDVLFTVERAIDRYYATRDVVQRYFKYGIHGWDTLQELADDLKMRIVEACEQRKKLNMPIPPEASVFMEDKGKNA